MKRIFFDLLEEVISHERREDALDDLDVTGPAR
jgi:hypothetical protein